MSTVCFSLHHKIRYPFLNFDCFIFFQLSNLLFAFCLLGQMAGYYSPYASGFTAAQMAAAAAAAAQQSQVNKPKMDTRGQFHQHFTRSFFVQNFPAKIICTYILGL
jgi:hypothetical protein